MEIQIPIKMIGVNKIMKILWIVNTIIPEIGKAAGISSGIGGGWLSGISERLSVTPGYELTICFPYQGKQLDGNYGNVRYFSFITEGFYKYSQVTERRFCAIIEQEKPNLIHIFGTEFPHSLAAVNVAEKCGLLEQTVISIQGLVSVYAKHYYAGLPRHVVYSNSLRDFLRRDNIRWQAEKYSRRGKFEVEALKEVKHVIGRTDWDEACAKYINKYLHYHFCNETLRDVFYSGQWEYSRCEKHSIFLGSSSYPIKGLHCVLEVFPKILSEFPDAKLFVTGNSPLKKQGIKGYVHRTAYQSYLERLIRKHDLEDKVVFLGSLSAEEMKNRMLASNVYILPSAIENSPNTLGEAMLLGVPCIAADVGGVKNMATNMKDALIYPFDENYMLPLYVSKIFNDVEFADKLSVSAKKHASITHNKEINNNTLINIYNELVKSGTYGLGE